MSDSWRRNTSWRWLLSNWQRQQWQHSMALRLVLSAAFCWWLLAPGSALLALIFRQFSQPSEAVVLAGFSAELGHWQWAFWPMALLSLLLVLLFWRYLPPSRHFVAKPFSWRQALKDNSYHLRQKVLLLTYLIGGLNFFIYLNQYTYIAFVLTEPPYALSSGWIGLLFLTYLTGTLGSAISGRISKTAKAGQGGISSLQTLRIADLSNLAVADEDEAVFDGCAGHRVDHLAVDGDGHRGLGCGQRGEGGDESFLRDVECLALVAGVDAELPRTVAFGSPLADRLDAGNRRHEGAGAGGDDDAAGRQALLAAIVAGDLDFPGRNDLRQWHPPSGE